jgi:hypothetical protein
VQPEIAYDTKITLQASIQYMYSVNCGISKKRATRFGTFRICAQSVCVSALADSGGRPRAYRDPRPRVIKINPDMPGGRARIAIPAEGRMGKKEEYHSDLQ